MKKIIVSMLGVFLLGMATSALADDAVQTLTGEGKCAKCALHQTEKCQTALQVEKDGKTTTYLLAQNDVSKKFHENVCEASKKITVTGKVSEKDGKEIITASKIEVAN